MQVQGRQLLGWHNLALPLEPVLGTLESRKTFLSSLASKKRASAMATALQASLPHTVPAHSAGHGLTRCAGDTRQPVPSRASSATHSKNTRRLELHPCSPAAQKRLRVKQKLLPLVKQSLKITRNTYFLKIWKVTTLSLRIVQFGLCDHLRKKSSHVLEHAALEIFSHLQRKPSPAPAASPAQPHWSSPEHPPQAAPFWQQDTRRTRFVTALKCRK